MSRLALVFAVAFLILSTLVEAPRESLALSDLAKEAQLRLSAKGSSSPVPAVPSAKTALAFEPLNPYRWADLGAAYASSDPSLARAAFRTACRTGGHLDAIALRCAEFHSSSGEYSQALPYLKRILTHSTAPAEAIFSFYLRHNLPNPASLDDGVPALRAPAEAYFHFLLDKPPAGGRRPSRRQVRGAWNWMAAQSLTTAPLANDYVRYLLAEGLFADARALWLAQFPPAAENAGNFVFNAGFEAAPHDWFFDWTLSPWPHVETGVDTTAPHTGRAALRIRFDGLENVSFSHVTQDVVVSPGSYCLSAWIRTDAVTSDRGVGLRIYDRRKPERFDAFLPAFLGTAPWQNTRQCFEIPEGTPLVQIMVVRSSSTAVFDRIGGTVWLDDIELRREEP